MQGAHANDTSDQVIDAFNSDLVDATDSVAAPEPDSSLEEAIVQAYDAGESEKSDAVDYSDPLLANPLEDVEDAQVDIEVSIADDTRKGGRRVLDETTNLPIAANTPSGEPNAADMEYASMAAAIIAAEETAAVQV